MPFLFLRRLLPLLGLFVSVVASGGVIDWQPDGAPVCTDPGNQVNPVAIADDTGATLVVWYDYRGSSLDIYMQRVLPSGARDPAWPPYGLPVCTASGTQFLPVIVSDGADGAIVAWQDERASSSNIYAHHVLATGETDPAWPVNGLGVCTSPGDQVSPVMIPDGNGGAILAWRDFRGGPDANVYAHRVLTTGETSPVWPEDGLEICTASGHQSRPSIASDGQGGALIVWSDLRNGVDSDIYAQRVLPSGMTDPAWPANGRSICSANFNQSEPFIVEDGAGGAIVAWYDLRSGTSADIYAQHVSSTGVANGLWPVDGVALCTAPGEQYTPLLVSDGAGGAIAAWYDYRSGELADVYAARVLASGVPDPAWPTDGRALCVDPGDQVTPAISPDGDAGAWVTWMDYRGGASSDVYAHHVLGSGAVDPFIPLNGMALCVAGGDQFSPRPVWDGSGVVVAWTDFRQGAYADIYAQRVESGVNAAVEPLARPSGIRLHAPRPNPVLHFTTIWLEIDDPQRIRVEVLDAAGRSVKVLLSSRVLEAGLHDLSWSPRQPAGFYWIRAQAQGGTETRQVVVLP